MICTRLKYDRLGLGHAEVCLRWRKPIGPALNLNIAGMLSKSGHTVRQAGIRRQRTLAACVDAVFCLPRRHVPAGQSGESNDTRAAYTWGPRNAAPWQPRDDAVHTGNVAYVQPGSLSLHRCPVVLLLSSTSYLNFATSGPRPATS